MKEVLRQLLEAEEAGRQAAAQLEQTGEEILLHARAECEEIARQGRLDAASEIEGLRDRTRAQTEAGRQAIAQEADASIERLRCLAARQRAEAVARVVAILLGEAKP
jgi:vacuolar-type H+-ATPase subunit H